MCMKKINDLETFEALLDSRNRAEPVCITTATPVIMNKGKRDDPNPFYGRVTKLAQRLVWIGCSYERSVNRQREREQQPLQIDGQLEEFCSEDLWRGKGEMLNRYIAQHIESGERYIAFRPQRDLESIYLWVDGSALTAKENAELGCWLKDKPETINQGIDKIIPWRILTLKNLLKIKMNKSLYLINIPSQREE